MTDDAFYNRDEIIKKITLSRDANKSNCGLQENLLFLIASREGHLFPV